MERKCDGKVFAAKIYRDPPVAEYERAAFRLVQLEFLKEVARFQPFFENGRGANNIVYLEDSVSSILINEGMDMHLHHLMYVDGELGQQLSLDMIRSILQDTSWGAAYLHAVGLIHGDIEPKVTRFSSSWHLR